MTGSHQVSQSAAQTTTPPPPGPDSQVQPGTPTGDVIKGEFDLSKVYPGTWREYWVYIPKQLDRAKPAPVMVFQDGLQYSAPVVFDNLIHKKDVPPMVGVFVMHGRVRAPSADALDRMNRSFEYDAVSDDYARFLLDELLPYISKTHGLTLSSDPNDRGIAGNSSGAIAAFAAAWQRPDAFRRVFSGIGTYVGLRGGNEFPVLIRKTEPKPIRVFLQDGRNDLNNYTGDWFIANQDMLSALQFAGYDVRYDWGDGEHNSHHATAIFPDALRWLWRDWPSPIKANPEGKSRQDVFQTLIPGEEWQLVTDRPVHGAGVAVNANGEVFLEDTRENRIYRVGLDGNVTPFAEHAGLMRALTFGSDGRLYGAAPRSAKIYAFDASGKPHIVADNVHAIDLAMNVKGDLYFTDGSAQKVWLLPKGGKPRVVDEGIQAPVGVLFSPDQTLLYVSDHVGQLSWAFQIQPDGSLAHKQRYFYVHMRDAAESGAADMTVDTLGSVYMATALGVQVFDQIGKCHAIISAPVRAPVTNVKFGGASLNEMYIVNDHKLYKRKIKVKGVLSWRPPLKPGPPRL
ncbi:MAG: gluconolactonase [Acidobacteria bacterium]|nr:MAG: gluconolactonase [Acidobacteriota bacterium]